MRGEAPRGVPLAGRSKALKGEPKWRCTIDGSSPGSEGSKPPGGYSNPEGGSCRGVEPPGNPDPPSWYVP
jgi:hypothetical protein